MTPLQWPADFDLAANQTWWRRYPGGSRRVFERVSDRLRNRAWPGGAVWGDEPARASIAWRICRRVKELYGWPNDHFLPGDPVAIVMHMPWDDLDIVEFVMQIEEDFKIMLPDEEAEKWRTLGDIVDSVIARIRT